MCKYVYFADGSNPKSETEPRISEKLQTAGATQSRGKFLSVPAPQDFFGM